MDVKRDDSDGKSVAEAPQSFSGIFDQIKFMERGYTRTRKELEDEKQKNETLQGKLHKLEKQHTAMQEQKTTWQKQMSSLHEQMAAMREQMTDMQDQMTAHQAEDEKKHVEAEAKEIKLQSVRMDLYKFTLSVLDGYKAMKFKNGSLEREMTAKEEKISELTNEVVVSDIRLQEIAERMEQCENELKKRVEEVKATKEANKKLQIQLSKKEGPSVEMKNEVTKRESLIFALNNEKEKSQKLESAVCKLKEEIQSLNKQAEEAAKEAENEKKSEEMKTKAAVDGAVAYENKFNDAMHKWLDTVKKQIEWVIRYGNALDRQGCLQDEDKTALLEFKNMQENLSKEMSSEDSEWFSAIPVLPEHEISLASFKIATDTESMSSQTSPLRPKRLDASDKAIGETSSIDEHDSFEFVMPTSRSASLLSDPNDASPACIRMPLTKALMKQISDYYVTRHCDKHRASSSHSDKNANKRPASVDENEKSAKQVKKPAKSRRKSTLYDSEGSESASPRKRSTITSSLLTSPGDPISKRRKIAGSPAPGSLCRENSSLDDDSMIDLSEVSPMLIRQKSRTPEGDNKEQFEINKPSSSKENKSLVSEPKMKLDKPCSNVVKALEELQVLEVRADLQRELTDILTDALLGVSSEKHREFVIETTINFLSVHFRNPFEKFFTDAIPSPSLPLNEQCVVEAYMQCAFKRGKDFLLTKFMRLAPMVIILAKDKDVSGLAAVCRVYTLFCRNICDVESAKSLSYNIIMKKKMPEFPCLVASIAIAWNDVLNFKRIEGRSEAMYKVLSCILSKKPVGLSDDLFQHCLNVFRNICGLLINDREDADFLCRAIMSEIEKKSDEYPFPRDEAQDFLIALDLLSAHQGWAWTRDNIIVNRLLPYVGLVRKKRAGAIDLYKSLLSKLHPRNDEYNPLLEKEITDVLNEGQDQK